MRLIIDTLGGDRGCAATVPGGIAAMKAHPEISLIFTGNEADIRAALRAADPSGSFGEPAVYTVPEEGKQPPRIAIVHAPEAISGEEKPSLAVREKTESSMLRGIQLLRSDPTCDALVSTGSTGALVVASTIGIPRVRGIRRPAFCPILPTMTGGIVGVCDSGANVDITPQMLVQFAIMGSRYLEGAFGVKNPRVALLNIGTESEKGDALRKAAYPMLQAAPGVNFVGNMESRDLLSGNYDLIVCDGFAGNVLVKTTEGTALELLRKIKKDIYSRRIYQLGAFFMRKMFAEQKEFLNYQNYGGSVLLGLDKIVVKGHGSSDEKAVARCVEQALAMQQSNLNDRIKASLEALKALEKTTEEA